MSFKLCKEARDYFTKIDKESTTGKFESVWDFYYLCLMIGFKFEKMGEEPSSDEFNKNFHSSYEMYKYQIIASLVSTEVRRQGILLTQSEIIKNLMLELLNQESQTKLSKNGIDLMNKYADGGFKIINEKIPKPIELDEFMTGYYENFIKI